MKKLTRNVLIAMMITLTVAAFAETYAFPVEPATPTAMNISMSDAIAAAKNEMVQRQNLSMADIQNHRIKANFVKLENNEYAWMVIIESNEMNNRISALATVSSTAPEIIDYQASDPTTELTMILIDQWTKRKGPMRTWPVKDKALFDLLFGWQDAYLVPDASHISEEEAKNIALSALPQSFSSPEFSAAFRLLSYTDGRMDEYVWCVTVIEQGKERYLVNISAVDGSVVEIIELSGLG